MRKCRLDLAPEAPWRCPDDCRGYEKRRIDAGWQLGSLQQSVQAAEPEPKGQEVAALLDEAEEIVNAAAPDILAEIEREQSERGYLKNLKRKNKKKRK